MGLSTRAKLSRRQREMHAAGERLEIATRRRDDAIWEAVEDDGISQSEIGRLLGIRRETVYYAKLRAEARRNGEEQS
jgi:hypothetical protein